MHKPVGLLVLGFLQARDRFYWPRAPDHRLISKTATMNHYKYVWRQKGVLSLKVVSVGKTSVFYSKSVDTKYD